MLILTQILFLDMQLKIVFQEWMLLKDIYIFFPLMFFHHLQLCQIESEYFFLIVHKGRLLPTS